MTPGATPADLERLRVQLRKAGYTPGALQRGLHISGLDDIGRLNHAAAEERVAADRSAAATLIRLFFLEDDEPQRNVVAVLPRRRVEDLVAARVLRVGNGTVRARLRIDPVGDQYFIGDLRFRRFDRTALRLPGRDPVYPPSSDSLMLRDVIAAPPVQDVLDLCTGSGVQAIQRAPTAQHVVAVDINPRAVALARLNTRLNGVNNVELRAGDLYAPVRGEQFDLIIANPPFVSSPYERGPSYHAGGPTGDRVLRRILAGGGKHLRPGGRLFAISHLALRADETMSAVTSRWFRDFPGRAVVLVVETGTPVDLAAAQALFALDRGLAAYAAELRRWVQYLRRHRVSSVSLVLIAAEAGSRTGLEVVDAHARVLPLPLSPPPASRIASWLQA